MVESSNIIFSQVGNLGKILLNRPKALNSLTLDMIRAMQSQLDIWQGDPTVAAVLLEGAGERAFCAGGDIRRLAESATSSDVSYCKDFFSSEFRLNRNIYKFTKPYVAILDGITMGGGVGLSVHAPFRVATHSTLFAMPETGIGYFPDVGASYFLPRCASQIGMYLGLTGHRLNGEDCVEVGIGTHFVKREKLLQLVARLEEITLDRDPKVQVTEILKGYNSQTNGTFCTENSGAIAHCFSRGSIEEIFDALEAYGTEWSQRTLHELRKKSPYSLKVVFRQLREGESLTFEGCMIMELRLALRFMREPNFYEGVRAVIVEKDNKPNWKPKEISEVNDEQVANFFLPLIEGDLSF